MIFARGVLIASEATEGEEGILVSFASISLSPLSLFPLYLSFPSIEDPLNNTLFKRRKSKIRVSLISFGCTSLTPYSVIYTKSNPKFFE
jgi:hypothetical protein